MTPECAVCKDEIDPPQRAKISKLCKACGEKAAKQERKSWCVLTPHKQGPMFFTQAFAREAAKGINNKGGFYR